MNRQHILSRLARRGWDICYSTGAMDWWNRNTQEWRDAPLFNHAQMDSGVSLAVSGRLFARWRRYSLWDMTAIRLHSHYLHQIACKGNPRQPVGVIIFHPSYFPYLRFLPASFVVFHVYDMFSKMEGWSPELARFEQDLIRRADLISASSELSIKYLEELGGNARILPNGVDESLLVSEDLPCPSDLAVIPHPRIGIVGNLNRKLDFRIIAEVAEKRPQWHWVLIGPIVEAELLNDEVLANSFVRCRSLPNVHFLGPRNRSEVRPYLAHLDIHTVCYRMDMDWVVAGSPLKLFEGLASGRPVISAPVHLVKECYSDVVAVAENTSEWIDAIKHAITQGGKGNPASRRARAAENCWDRRVDQFEEWLIKML